MADMRHTIPKDFTLREQAIVVHQTAVLKEDFISKRRSMGKMSDEDMNLQAYNVAVLFAAAATLKALHAERKSGQRELEQKQEVAPRVEEKAPAPAENSPPMYERPPAADDDF